MDDDVVAARSRPHFFMVAGRTRIEPVAIVVLSVIMALASVQMTIESVEKIISFARGDGQGPVFGVVTICICASTIGEPLANSLPKAFGNCAMRLILSWRITFAKSK